MTLSCVKLRKDTRKYQFCPFKECRRAVKKLSQHLQYKHPTLDNKQRRAMCIRARVAPGKGALKSLPKTPQQQTLVLERVSHGGAGTSTCGDERQKDERACGSERPRAYGGGRQRGAKAYQERESLDQMRKNTPQSEEEIDEEREGATLEMEQAKVCGKDGQLGVDGEMQSDCGEEWEREEQGFYDTEEEMDEGRMGDPSDKDLQTSELSSEEFEIIPANFDLYHPFLVRLREHLTSRHGKSRSENGAKAICMAVLKYLSFAGTELNPANLYNPQIIDSYLNALEHQEKKATTQHATLCRIKQGLAFVNLSLDTTETTKAEKCLTLITNWLSALGKEARRINLEEISEKGSASLTEIERFAKCSEMSVSLRKVVGKIRNQQMTSQHDLRLIMVWLAGCLLHCNAQRPGAVTNASLAEYESATTSKIGRETYKTIIVANHQTATTGRTRLSADSVLSQNLELFAKYIRPKLEWSDSTLLFSNREGKPFDHLSRHVKQLASKFNIDLPKTATETRHAAATAVAGSREPVRNAVAAAMSHSRRTQELYYSLRKGRKDALEGYRVIEGMRQGEEGRERQDNTGTRNPFTDAETNTIAAYFSDHISSKTPSTSSECRKFLKEHPLSRSEKQIRDKVRNIIGRQ